MDKQPFWCVRLSEIEATVRAARTGRVSVIAHSAGDRPVYAVSYGQPSAHVPLTNFSGAAGAGPLEAYRREQGDRQVVFLIGCCHGAEMEGTAALCNLIHLLETGVDYRGQRCEELHRLANLYRLVIIPCLNPDGRDRSPDHIIGRSREEAVRINQGIWADGRTIGYPACKLHQPLMSSEVRHFGGYPNDGGYNIMHDAIPGDLRTSEAAGLLKMIATEGADLALHFHSHENPPEILAPSHGMLDLHRQRIVTYRRRLMEAFEAKGFDVCRIPEKDPAAMFLGPPNLPTLTSMASGALSPVFEQPNGSGGYAIDLETMLEHALGVIELFLRCGLTERFSPRYELINSNFPSDTPLVRHRPEGWK